LRTAGLSLEKLRIILLSDFYGNLLTDKQQKFLKLHYEADLSYGEIAERCGLTRQAVHDSVKSAKIALERYEEKLRLLIAFQRQQAMLSEILEHLQNLETNLESTENVRAVQYIRACIQGLMS
jgi:predicted DNA-binding protein YlxM (UPF0122 family)